MLVHFCGLHFVVAKTLDILWKLSFDLCVYRVLLQVECIRLPTDTDTQRLKGFGYAEFKDVDNLLAAVHLNAEVSWCEERGNCHCTYVTVTSWDCMSLWSPVTVCHCCSMSLCVTVSFCCLLILCITVNLSPLPVHIIR